MALSGTHFHGAGHCSTALWEQHVLLCGPANVLGENVLYYGVTQCYSEGLQETFGWSKCHMSQESMEVIKSFSPRQNHFKETVPPLIARFDISGFLSLGPSEGESVQE
jgi:hypothetical protein